MVIVRLRNVYVFYFRVRRLGRRFTARMLYRRSNEAGALLERMADTIKDVAGEQTNIPGHDSATCGLGAKFGHWAARLECIAGARPQTVVQTMTTFQRRIVRRSPEICWLK